MSNEPVNGGIDEDADAFYNEQQIRLNLKVLEMAASDEEFKDEMERDPEAALHKAGLLEEARAVAAADAEAAGAEVSGHRSTIYRTCYWWDRRIRWHRR